MEHWMVRGCMRGHTTGSPRRPLLDKFFLAQRKAPPKEGYRLLNFALASAVWSKKADACFSRFLTSTWRSEPFRLRAEWISSVHGPSTEDGQRTFSVPNSTKIRICRESDHRSFSGGFCGKDYRSNDAAWSEVDSFWAVSFSLSAGLFPVVPAPGLMQ